MKLVFILLLLLSACTEDIITEVPCDFVTLKITSTQLNFDIYSQSKSVLFEITSTIDNFNYIDTSVITKDYYTCTSLRKESWKRVIRVIDGKRDCKFIIEP